MAVGPTTNASVADLRTLTQPQDATTRPQPQDEQESQATAGVGESEQGTNTEQAQAAATDTASERGENNNPGVASQTVDDRLPNSGDPNRGTTLDIAV